MGAITMPVREGLDNLVFVVNCNLQRLDGPVRGNGKIIQELEAVFRGAGWNVIKVIWGSISTATRSRRTVLAIRIAHPGPSQIRLAGHCVARGLVEVVHVVTVGAADFIYRVHGFSIIVVTP